MVQQIHLLSGIPASGKSYYLDHCIGEDPFNRILHRDDVRAQLREYYNKPDEYFPCPKEEEFDAWILACVSVIIAHPNAHHYWFDQTSLGNGAVAKFYNALAIALGNIGINITNYQFIIDIMDTDYDLCVARNAKREGFSHVPEDVLNHMAEAPRPNRWARFLLRTPKGAVPSYVQIHTIISDEREMI